MALMLPEMLQLEILSDSNFVNVLNPEGKEPRLLRERSRTRKFGKPESLPKLVNLLVERFSTLIEEKEAFPELGSNPIVPPILFSARLTSSKLCIDQNQPGT